MSVEFQSALSISDMARRVGLSRQRFHQLVAEGVFPAPVYSISNRRPFYTEEMQAACLKVRQRNFGINGRPVLFYARRPTTIPKAEPKAIETKVRGKKREPNLPAPDVAKFTEGLKQMGLVTVKDADVHATITTLYPNGIAGTDDGIVLRALFLRLRVLG